MSAYLPVVLGLLGTLVAALPVWWMVRLHGQGRYRDPAYWWIAAGFGVSFIADALAGLGSAYIADETTLFLFRRAVNDIYPVLQAALVAHALLDEHTEWLFIAGLFGAAMVSPLLTGLGSPDLLLATVALLGITWIAYRRPEFPVRLRRALLIGFGLFWVGWVWQVYRPGWLGWGTYQTARVAGTVLFMLAALKPGPALKVAR